MDRDMKKMFFIPNIGENVCHDKGFCPLWEFSGTKILFFVDFFKVLIYNEIVKKITLKK